MKKHTNLYNENETLKETVEKLKEDIRIAEENYEIEIGEKNDKIEELKEIIRNVRNLVS
jgi:endonuclease IV